MSAKTSFCALRSVKSGNDEVAYSSPSLLAVKMSTRVDGVGDRKRFEEQRIDQREHRGVDADAEPDGQHRDER